jgi:hypothetical protein
LFRIQKARIIQPGNEHDLIDNEGGSADSEKLADEYAQMATQVELRGWHCHSHLDRQLLLGVFENKPDLALTSEQNNADSSGIFIEPPDFGTLNRKANSRQSVEELINKQLKDPTSAAAKSWFSPRHGTLSEQVIPEEDRSFEAK